MSHCFGFIHHIWWPILDVFKELDIFILVKVKLMVSDFTPFTFKGHFEVKQRFFFLREESNETFFDILFKDTNGP